ncbi:MAG: DUF2996 domain-containing protein [Cyanobacteria bacterium SW_9_44_58]|nr:MAG: DUF2996 domain-containing protein [Cyanobacteria bacterium SW_9_44_58]
MSEQEQSKQANQAGSSAQQPNSEQQASQQGSGSEQSSAKPQASEQGKAKQASQSDATAAKQGSAKGKAKAASKGDSSSKKEEEPPIEDKPFPEFIEQHFLPAVKQALNDEGINDLALDFKKDEFPFPGAEECSQVVGKWDGGKRRFNLYFLEEDISGKKAFSYSASDAPPSTIESFMIDERKVNLELLVMYTVQRLNGQKWLARN